MSSPDEEVPEGAAAPRRSTGAALVGLRVDACTYQGCQEGLPGILEALDRRGIRATIFPAMGPDRSGLAVLRIFRKKGFLGKMLRTGAASMYGFRTALYGTLLPSPIISARCREVIRRAADAGHEVGIHSWDHVGWQDGLDALGEDGVRADYERAMEAFEKVTGRRPTCTAAPAWIASDASLLVEERLGFQFACDTRGRSPFLPRVEGRALDLPQVPLTLPTLDELLGGECRTPGDFNEYILGALVPGASNVHTAHAEAEGRAYRAYFEEFLDRARAGGWRFVTLGELLAAAGGPLPVCEVGRGLVQGRAGAVSLQGAPQEGAASPGTRSSP